MDPRKSSGRPKDEQLNAKITQATWSLLDKRPLASLTFSDIAKQANTSRPAIYRRWNSVEEIVIDAFLEVVCDKVPRPAASNPPDALKEYVQSLVHFLGSRVGKVMAEILGRAQNNPGLMEKFHTGFLGPRRDHGRALIERGQSEGSFRKDIDSDLIIDMYAGPIYFRAFAGHGKLDKAFAIALAERVIDAISPN